MNRRVRECEPVSSRTPAPSQALAVDPRNPNVVFQGAAQGECGRLLTGLIPGDYTGRLMTDRFSCYEGATPDHWAFSMFTLAVERHLAR